MSSSASVYLLEIKTSKEDVFPILKGALLNKINGRWGERQKHPELLVSLKADIENATSLGDIVYASEGALSIALEQIYLRTSRYACDQIDDPVSELFYETVIRQHEVKDFETHYITEVYW